MVLTTHLTDDELTDLLEENLPPRGQEGGLIHLSACRSCHERLQELFPEVAPGRFRKWFGTSEPPESSAPSTLDLEVALHWNSEKVRGALRELEAARELWSEVRHLERRQRRQLILDAPRFRTQGFAVVLLSATEQAWRCQPAEALDLADLATHILERLLPYDSRDAQRVHDLQARAFGCRANSHRILGRWECATLDLQRALAHLNCGAGQPLDRAGILGHLSTLHRDRRHFSSSRKTLDAARTLYEEVGDFGGIVRVFIKMGATLREAHQPMQGVKILKSFLGTCNLKSLTAEDRRMIHHNLSLLLIDLGRTTEASVELIRARQLMHESPEKHLDEVRLDWLDALLHERIGRVERAAQKCRGLQKSFLEAGLGADAASVTLDLATNLLNRGRVAEAKHLAVELVPVFLAMRLHREAMASWLLFWQASRR